VRPPAPASAGTSAAMGWDSMEVLGVLENVVRSPDLGERDVASAVQVCTAWRRMLPQGAAAAHALRSGNGAFARRRCIRTLRKSDTRSLTYQMASLARVAAGREEEPGMRRWALELLSHAQRGRGATPEAEKLLDAALVKCAGDPAVQVRHAALECMQRNPPAADRAASVDAAVTALSDGNLKVRRVAKEVVVAAVRALGCDPFPGLIPSLVELLSRPEGAPQASETLVALGAAVAPHLETLLRVLGHEAREARRAGLCALAWLTSSASLHPHLPALVVRLEDSCSHVRREAQARLLEMAQALQPQQEGCAALAEALASRLRHTDAKVRAAALHVFIRLPSEAAGKHAGAVVGMLVGSDTPTRDLAMRELRRLGTHVAPHAAGLVTMCSSKGAPNGWARQVGVSGLVAWLGAPQCAPLRERYGKLLAGYLEDPDRHLREHTARKLGSTCDWLRAAPEARAAVYRRLEHTTPEVRRAAVTAAAPHVTHRAEAERLVPLVADEDSAVRRAAVQAVRIMDPALRALLREGLNARLTDESAAVRRAALEALGDLVDRSRLRLMLTDVTSTVRSAALDTVARAGAAPFASEVAARLEDPSATVQCDALHVLADCTDVQVRLCHLPAMVGKLECGDRAVRARAVEVLCAMSRVDAVAVALLPHVRRFLDCLRNPGGHETFEACMVDLPALCDALSNALHNPNAPSDAIKHYQTLRQLTRALHVCGAYDGTWSADNWEHLVNMMSTSQGL